MSKYNRLCHKNMSESRRVHSIARKIGNSWLLHTVSMLLLLNILLLVLFCCVLIPQFILQLIMGSYGIAAVYAGLLLLYMAIFGVFAVKYHHMRNGR